MGLALKRLTAVTKGGAYKLEHEFPAGMKGLADEIVRCVRQEFFFRFGLVILTYLL